MTIAPAKIRLVITDLDNTLYDWVTFFAHSFIAMSDELANLLGVQRDQIFDEFKAVHQHFGNSEQPFAVLELPSVLKKFPQLSRDEMLLVLSGPLKAFNSVRKRHLRLYPTVFDTLQELRKSKILIVGHTEAVVANAFYRLQRLEIAAMFRRLYSLQDKIYVPSHGSDFEFPSSDFLVRVPREERKPNPRLLLDICSRENVAPAEALYVGDSLTRDIGMAKEAGVCAVWARYGTRYDKGLWNTLVKITHWTDEDVAREGQLNHRYHHVSPDFVIDEFGDLLDIVGIRASRTRAADSKGDLYKLN